jgi:hypothetical protein
MLMSLMIYLRLLTLVKIGRRYLLISALACYIRGIVNYKVTFSNTRRVCDAYF